jgi:O-antigen/teichoic acid export membrane protein
MGAPGRAHLSWGRTVVANQAASAGISLRRRLLAGASWSMTGYVLAQAMRLATNLLLTHLLAPEHFGLMALVNVLMIGLAMFSDIGIGPGIIQSARGTDQRYLDTAWTLQFLRGIAMWVCCVIATWPFARFYEQPLLVWIVPVAGLSAVISGLNSTKIFTLQREIDLRRLTLLELGSQAITAAAMCSAPCSVRWSGCSAATPSCRARTTALCSSGPPPGNCCASDAGSSSARF